MSKKNRNTIMSGIMLMSGLIAGNGYCKPTDDTPKEQPQLEERMGNYPLNGGEVPSTEFYQKMQIANGLYLTPFIEVKDMQMVNHNEACPVDELYCKESNQHTQILGGGIELELRLNENKKDDNGFGVYLKVGVENVPSVLEPVLEPYEKENRRNFEDRMRSIEVEGGVSYNLKILGVDTTVKIGPYYNDATGLGVAGIVEFNLLDLLK